MLRKTILAIFVALTVLPLAFGLGYSILYSLGLAGLMGEGFTLRHWQALWRSSDAIGSLLYSLYLTVASLLLMLAPALALAWWQVFGQAKRWLLALLFVPLTFPPLVAAFSWYSLLSPAGILSRVAQGAGLINSPDNFPRLVSDAWGISILATHVYIIAPLFALLFIYQARKERMAELRAMSMTLGSSQGQFVRQVFVPLLLGKTAPFLLLYAIFLFGAYEVPLLAGRSSPRAVAVFITDKMGRYNLQDIPVGHAMAVTYSLLVIALAALFINSQRRPV